VPSPRPALACPRPGTGADSPRSAQRGHGVGVVQEWLPGLGPGVSLDPARLGLSGPRAPLCPLVSQLGGGKYGVGGGPGGRSTPHYRIVAGRLDVWRGRPRGHLCAAPRLAAPPPAIAY